MRQGPRCPDPHGDNTLRVPERYFWKPDPRIKESFNNKSNFCIQYSTLTTSTAVGHSSATNSEKIISNSREHKITNKKSHTVVKPSEYNAFEDETLKHNHIQTDLNT